MHCSFRASGTQCFQIQLYWSNFNLGSSLINLTGGGTNGGEDTGRVGDGENISAAFWLGSSALGIASGWLTGGLWSSQLYGAGQPHPRRVNSVWEYLELTEQNANFQMEGVAVIGHGRRKRGVRQWWRMPLTQGSEARESETSLIYRAMSMTARAYTEKPFLKPNK